MSTIDLSVSLLFLGYTHSKRSFGATKQSLNINLLVRDLTGSWSTKFFEWSNGIECLKIMDAFHFTNEYLYIIHGFLWYEFLDCKPPIYFYFAYFIFYLV